MVAEAIVIRELTGSQRSVELRNRALAYQQVEYPGKQHYAKTWYPGNPVATIQILGPQENDTEFLGMWKARYIGTHVVVSGFDDLITPVEIMTPEILVQIFHRLRKAGNQLEVSWGPEVRRGILAEFTPNYHRIEDIEWRMLFTWSQVGEIPDPRAAEVSSPQADIDASQVNLDDIASRIPVNILPNVANPILANFDSIRAGTTTAMIDIAGLFGASFVSREQFENFNANIEQILLDCNELIGRTGNGPYLPFIPTDSVSALLAAETWRREARLAALSHQVVMINARESIRGRVVSGFLGRVTVRQGETLRGIALRFYGSADAWTLIAETNNLTTASPPTGTVILIPRPDSSAAATVIQQ